MTPRCRATVSWSSGKGSSAARQPVQTRLDAASREWAVVARGRDARVTTWRDARVTTWRGARVTAGRNAAFTGDSVLVAATA
jgi:hypothetical protein